MRGPRCLAHGIRLFVFLLLLLTTTTSLSAAAPTLTISNDAVRAQGITAGGQAVCWSVAQKGRGVDFTILRQVRSATDDDRDGIVTFDRGLATPFHSIFVIADVASGEVAIATPSGFEQKLELPTAVLKPGNSGNGLADLSLRSESIDVLLVRARAGAWRGFASEGTKRDKDGERNGRVALGIEQFAAVGGKAAAPQAFIPGDVLVLIEPRTMRFATVTVTQGAGVR